MRSQITERLDFEVDVVATPYENPEMIRSNFLYDIVENAGSLTEYTGEKLEEWKEYLQWKIQLAKRQIMAVNTTKLLLMMSRNGLNFWLVFEDKRNIYRFPKVFGKRYTSLW